MKNWKISLRLPDGNNKVVHRRARTRQRAVEEVELEFGVHAQIASITVVNDAAHDEASPTTSGKKRTRPSFSRSGVRARFARIHIDAHVISGLAASLVLSVLSAMIYDRAINELAFLVVATLGGAMSIYAVVCAAQIIEPVAAVQLRAKSIAAWIVIVIGLCLAYGVLAVLFAVADNIFDGLRGIRKKMLLSIVAAPLFLLVWVSAHLLKVRAGTLFGVFVMANAFALAWWAIVAAGTGVSIKLVAGRVGNLHAIAYEGDVLIFLVFAAVVGIAGYIIRRRDEVAARRG